MLRNVFQQRPHHVFVVHETTFYFQHVMEMLNVVWTFYKCFNLLVSQTATRNRGRKNCEQIEPCPVDLSMKPSKLNEQLFDARYCINLCNMRHFLELIWLSEIWSITVYCRVQKTQGFFLKSPTQWVFWVLLVLWVLLGFFGQAGKKGKIIQKLSNLKP